MMGLQTTWSVLRVSEFIGRRFLLLILLALVPFTTRAQYQYVTNNDSIEIVQYTGDGGSVTIPSMIDGLPVTVIKDSAFYGRSTMTEVTIPGTVTTIENYAFNGCFGLDIVRLTNGLVSIGSHAFDECVGLTNLTLPDGLSVIGDSAFRKCGFYEMTIPESVTNLEGAAFDGCNNLGSVTISSNVPVVAIGLFYNCVSLTNVTIGGAIGSIGHSAFLGCHSLTSVVIPNSVTNIGSAAFSDCFSLGNLTITNGGMIIESEAFSSAGLTNVTITNATVSIGSDGFGSCTNLRNVTLGLGVTNLGYAAFYGCANLTNVDLPNSIPSLESYTFGWCTSLTELAIPASVTNIGLAFHYCTGLTAINVDALNPRYASLGGVLFDQDAHMLVQCPGGKAGSYTIPDGVQTIGESAFSSCTLLTDVTMPSSVTLIKDYAFYYCYALTNVSIPEGVVTIGGYAFYGSGITHISIPSTVASILGGTFRNCLSLTAIDVAPLNPDFSSVDGVLFDKVQKTIIAYPAGRPGPYALPEGVLEIPAFCFYECRDLQTVIIPDSVVDIKVGAFADCFATNFTVDPANLFYSSAEGVLFDKSQTTLIAFPSGRYSDYTIPSGVTTIDTMAFYLCQSMTKIVVPETVTTITYGAFEGSFNLREVHFLGNAPTTVDSSAFYWDGYVTVYYRPGTTGWSSTLAGRPTALWDPEALNYTFVVTNSTVTITGYIGSSNSVTIPSTLNGFPVTKIPYTVFFGSTNLTSITLPVSLTTIDDQLFAYCRNLTNVTIPDSVTNIGNRVFIGCTNLVQCSLGNGVETIGSEAFKDCTGLTTISLPDSITDIGEQAFAGCTGLTNIQLPASLESINLRLFDGCTALTSVVIPENVTDIGPYALNGCTNLAAVTLPNSLTYIDGYAFADCSRLGSISIPRNVTTIAYGAFIRCYGLTNLTIASGVYTIGNGAFASCSQLTTVTIPVSVNYFGDGAFDECTNLTGIYFLGNAPTTDGGGLFANDLKLTVYYLSGATGWGATFSAIHTVALGITPPAPTILFPTNGFQTSAEPQQVRGRVAAKAGVASIVYQLSNTFSGEVIEGTAAGTTNWTASITLLPGTNVFRARAVNPFGESTDAVTRYVLLRTNVLTVLTNGLGRVSPDNNGKPLFLGKPYSVTALPGANQLFSGWVSNGVVVSSSPTLNFIMQSNLVLQANFIANPFIPVAGVYNGLFCDTNNLSQASSGFVTLTVSTNQKFTGKLLLEGGTNFFRGKFERSGVAQVVIARTGKSVLNVLLSLDLTNGTDAVTGMVTATNFTSELRALRSIFSAANVTTNFNGNYVLAVSGSTNAALAPGGYGNALCTVRSNGVVALNGTLGDGTAITAAGPLLKGGMWPLYVRLYNGAGSFMAWVTFASHAVAVDAPFPLWFKQPTRSKLYPDGFALSAATLTMDGAIHIRPANGTAYLSFTNGSVHLTGGNLSSTIVESFTVGSNNVATMAPGTNHLVLFLNATNGTFSGRFVHPVTHVKTAIEGVLTPDIGLGHFVGTNQSGRVVIQPD